MVADSKAGEPKELVETSELVFLHKTLMRRSHKPPSNEPPDWTTVEAKYMQENNRHADLRQKYVSMAPRNSSIAPLYEV